ncbi:MAG: aspartate-semialdehyde dehydrogenase [Flavobacteriales bacterium]|nr:aspartate-semialdehyde dehydrogenase [Flavobacteriales bacterium]|tara:strand:+ start:8443 stop:9426 length:984 start_codon:yes stop_codon:yes gene_type:complete
MTLAIIGATGLVGSEIIKILENEKIERFKNIFFVASLKNVGKKIKYRKKTYKIISIKKAIQNKPDYALFSAGSKTSMKYAAVFSKKGTTVIDNSSAFRMKKNIKLIVPEINKEILKKDDRIIANPNCSTIQLVLAIYPIHKKYKTKRIIVSTYQSVSGTGKRGVDQLQLEEKNKKPKIKAYQKNIHRNVIPKCDIFSENGYTKEEEKIINETNKILNSKIKITATAVRVPTLGGHGESVNIELEKRASIEQIIGVLKKQKGLFVDEGEKYKTPKEVKNTNGVYVSRIRQDYSIKNGFNMWIVADPLRKGAATNAIQILNQMITLRQQ